MHNIRSEQNVRMCHAGVSLYSNYVHREVSMSTLKYRAAQIGKHGLSLCDICVVRSAQISTTSDVENEHYLWYYYFVLCLYFHMFIFYILFLLLFYYIVIFMYCICLCIVFIFQGENQGE
mgnify:CR=1 FL=1